MAFWIWVVVILVLSLVAYEIISFIKRRRRPEHEVESEEAQRAAETQAELARATMKIAVLETRLEEAEIKHEDEQAALQAKYKEQLARAEAAYQRQMVALSEKLARNGRGDWRVAAKREKAKARSESERFPVRMAAEVAAWKAETFGDEPGEESAVSKGVTQSKTQQDTSNDRIDPAVNTQPTETAVPNSQATYEVIDHPRRNGVAAAVAAISGLSLAEIEATVEDEYGRLDDAPEEVQTFVSALAEWETVYGNEPPDSPLQQVSPVDWPSPSEKETAAEEAVWLPDRDEEVLEQITVYEEEPAAAAPDQVPQAKEEEAAAELLEAAEFEAQSSESVDDGEFLDHGEPSVDPEQAQAIEAESGEPAGDQAHDSAAEQDEINFFASPLPESEDPATQRALARRLASEMDADYLDEDEFLKELGIRQFAPEPLSYSGEEMEDYMGGENWVTDPIEELAYHLNGETVSEADEADVDDPADAPDFAAPEESMSEADADGLRHAYDVSNEAWEEMVFNGRSASVPAETNQQDESEEEEDDAEETAPDVYYDREEGPFIPPEQGPGADDEAIAATVAAILARAPKGKNKVEDARDVMFGRPRTRDEYETPYVEEPEPEPVPAGVPELEGAAAASATNGAGKSTIPSFVWQREPIVWDAQYYANTRLAEEPAVVRKDQEIDFNWRGMAPAQGVEARSFSVRWTGLLPLEAGQYRFTASAPDGLRLWLNGRLVISAWYDQSEQTYQRDFYWNGGPIDVRVEHYENGGDAKAFLTWERVA